MLVFLTASVQAQEMTPPADPAYTFSEYLEEIFNTMDKNYYLPVQRKVYDQFRIEFPESKIKALNERAQKTENHIHLGGGLLVLRLKVDEDAFTNLIPPDMTKEFKETAYAVTVDLGLEGNKTDTGFQISRVQKHSEAFSLNIRPGDILLKINGESVLPLRESKILELLTPEVGVITQLEILFVKENVTRGISLESKQYFTETVSVIPVDAEKTLALRVDHFNQKTSKDFSDELDSHHFNDIKNLIIDLRGNTGGPPLAARELMGFFTPPDDALFYIVRKNRQPVQLNSPVGYPYFEGNLFVLVDHKTGSAAETFSGVLQNKKRAEIVGQQTAGGAYLKSVHDFRDGSSLVMVTSRTFFPDRTVFPNNGITPDTPLPETEDTLDFVVQRLRNHPSPAGR